MDHIKFYLYLFWDSCKPLDVYNKILQVYIRDKCPQQQLITEIKAAVNKMIPSRYII
jgi:hypothetical protein